MVRIFASLLAPFVGMTRIRFKGLFWRKCQNSQSHKKRTPLRNNQYPAERILVNKTTEIATIHSRFYDFVSSTKHEALAKQLS